ncbi:MAG: helix-turn-helix domain-containing protein [Williamsia herbipolensis]|nr:helix-turn-helix domain-containing protein [Williamsia herbipolensis]
MGDDGVRDRAVSPPTDRVVDVMEMLAVEPDRRFSLAQISRAQGITRATGHAILATLVERGWVHRDDVDTTYGLGDRMGSVFARGRAPGRVLDDLLRGLGRDLDMPVSLATLRGRFLVVTDTVAPASVLSQVAPGLALPVIAPFGREYVAWADDDVRAEWMRVAEPAGAGLVSRLDAVLADVRGRGFTVDRLSRPLVRVHSALQALGDDLVVDGLSASLAAAYAELATIDVTDDELDGGGEISVATISVPVGSRGRGQAVTMSLAAQPFARLSTSEIRRVAALLRDAAERAGNVLAEAG